MSTPGYKKAISFAGALADAREADTSLEQVISRRDFGQASIASTGNPLDLAISGDGFFQLRDGETLVYSRQGQFHRLGDGSIVNAQGLVLQQAGGGDLILESGSPAIAEDGTILQQGRPVARIAVLRTDDARALTPRGDTLFTASTGMTEATGIAVRQGALENSNVVLGDEMVTMTAAMRQAESGARLIQIYDQLIDRAITTMGQGGK